MGQFINLSICRAIWSSRAKDINASNSDQTVTLKEISLETEAREYPVLQTVKSVCSMTTSFLSRFYSIETSLSLARLLYIVHTDQKTIPRFQVLGQKPDRNSKQYIHFSSTVQGSSFYLRTSFLPFTCAPIFFGFPPVEELTYTNMQRGHN